MEYQERFIDNEFSCDNIFLLIQQAEARGSKTVYYDYVTYPFILKELLEKIQGLRVCVREHLHYDKESSWSVIVKW